MLVAQFVVPDDLLPGNSHVVRNFTRPDAAGTMKNANPSFEAEEVEGLYDIIERLQVPRNQQGGGPPDDDTSPRVTVRPPWPTRGLAGAERRAGNGRADIRTGRKPRQQKMLFG